MLHLLLESRVIKIDPSIKLLYFTASFPPPFFGGSVGYIYNIVSNLPSGTAVVHTANINPQDAMKFDKTFLLLDTLGYLTNSILLNIIILYKIND